MPALVDKLSINKHDKKLDRRRKLTEKDRFEIRQKYFNVHPSKQPTQTALANEYNVNRRLIQFILFPEREERQKELAKERRKDGRYYDKEKSRLKIQDYRDYKRSLVQSGKLKP